VLRVDKGPAAAAATLSRKQQRHNKAALPAPARQQTDDVPKWRAWLADVVENVEREIFGLTGDQYEQSNEPVIGLVRTVLPLSR
jgi:hypothetical protein